MPKILSILRHRQIFLLWLGRLVSGFGDRFFDVAVVWLSVQIVGSEAGFILATEDLVFLAYKMGMGTGVDLEKLQGVVKQAEEFIEYSAGGRIRAWWESHKQLA